jgi:hypothetical protein
MPKKKTRKPKPKMLGTGQAAKAAKALKSRKARIAAALKKAGA